MSERVAESLAEADMNQRKPTLDYSSSVPRAYIVRPALFAPAALSLVAVALGVRDSWWYFAALPFIWLASICAQPNLNLANGCLAYVAIIVGWIVLAAFRPLGVAILAGSISGFYLSAIEKRIRMRPAPEA